MHSKWGGVIRKTYPDSRLLSIKRFKKGIINQTYDVKLENKTLVLRVYPKDSWKAKKEKYVYELIAKKTDVPVPKVLSSGKNYLLLSRIEGKTLNINNKILVRKAGELLAKLHSIKFPYYGWIVEDKIIPKFKKWVDFISYDLGLKFKKLPKVDSLLRGRIMGIIKDNKAILNINSQPCLLHKDYHSSHILADKGKINGIIDLEWAMAGHNELDIVKSCLRMFENKPKMEKAFLEGYKRYGTISKEFNERKKLYRIITLLSSLSFSHECKNKKWCIYNLKKLKGEFNEYYANNRAVY